MGRDAAAAYERYAEDDPWRSLCCLVEGTALCLGGDAPAGRERLLEAARRSVGIPLVHVVVNAQLALMLTDLDRHAAAELMAQAMSELDRHGLGDYPGTALPLAMAALLHAHGGQTDEAAAEVARGLLLLDRTRDWIPWIEIETRIVLARALIRLGEVSKARRLLSEASHRLEGFPGAALLASWLEEGRAALERASTESGLTPAELRVLQFMPTHLSFREIAQHLYVSPNTVKTQAQAIYRKLGVSARAEAVDLAREAGLLEEDEITTIG